MDDLDQLILLQLNHFVRDVTEFTADLLDDALTTDKQISFAHRLVDLAEAIRERATGERAPGRFIDASADRGSTPPTTS
jgi:hypothetical protein